MDPSSPSAAPRRVEVILKVAERCNLDCSYCYFFNGADPTFREHPAVISPATCSALARFLRAGVEELGLQAVQIDFHGGEPLLMGRPRFDAACRTFREALEPVVDFSLCVQTNATLVDEAWLKVFERHAARVSTSLDGPREWHDADRVDYAGRGSYDATARGLRLLQEAAAAQRIPSLGALCVVNPTRSAARIYRHLVHELGLRTVDFLLPDATHDSVSHPAAAYGRYLCELFDAWAADDDPDIQVRILDSVMSLLLGGPSRVNGFGRQVAPAITVASDGSLGPDDVLRACGPEVMRSGCSVFDTSLAGFLRGPFLAALEAARIDLPRACRECCWLEACGGGLLVNRHSAARGFRNPSVLCEGLKTFYAHVAAFLVEDGVAVEDLQASLRIVR